MRFHSYVDAGMFFTVAQVDAQKFNLNWYNVVDKHKTHRVDTIQYEVHTTHTTNKLTNTFFFYLIRES